MMTYKSIDYELCHFKENRLKVILFLKYPVGFACFFWDCFNVSIYKQDHHILSTMTEGSVTIEIEYWIQQQHS